MIIQRVLVTGGAGFIGSHTVNLLLSQNKEVTVLDNLFSGKIANLDLNHPNLTFIESDVLEFPFVAELIKNVDAVLHLAAIASVPQSIENPIYSFQVNSLGFLHVLLGVRDAGHPVRIVYASSAAVYGEHDGPCSDEKSLPKEVLSPYALQKLQMEDYAKLYSHLNNLKTLGLRYFNVYGERQDPHSSYSGVISKFLAAYGNNEPLIIFGDGQQTRDFIYVEDVARANLLALESDYTGVLNIGTGHPQTLLELVDFIQNAGQTPVQPQFEPPRPGDIKSSYATTEKAYKDLNFRYSVTLEEGIKKLIAHSKVSINQV